MKFATITAVVCGATLSAPAPKGEQVKLPDKFVMQCEYFLGDWATETEIDGTAYRGVWTVKWSPEKVCLITHWTGETPNGRSSGTRIHGWDALAKKLLVVDFGRDGSSSVERYEIVSDRVDEGNIVGVNAKGKPRKATARTDRAEPDMFTWTVTEDGSVTVNRFRRVKK